MSSLGYHLERVEMMSLPIPLRDPFVIATARIEAALSVIVTARVRVDGGVVSGLGESAAMPGASQEDVAGVVASIAAVDPKLRGRDVSDLARVTTELESLVPNPVARSGIEMAIVDAVARAQGIPARTLLGGELGAATRSLVSDITLPIVDIESLVERARAWRAIGFEVFKVKVGHDVDRDLRAMKAVAAAVPGARFRVDANCGYTAKDALALMAALERASLLVECFEQPCAKDDLDGMAEVTRALRVPVIADESVSSATDLARVIKHRAAHGINLKVVKAGGLFRTYELGALARKHGMPLMIGGMIETRLGMTAAAHVAAALGGIEFVDLDTAWLLASDPFRGGYQADGPRYTLSDAPGFGVDPV